ncbi:MAG: UTP--glucose-1-phosphate uridylyltransferase [Patescibacteria group bacterium]|nr:UTP--glucose-1-phosphate uridylyltransferase [Patescibacteria group bacterium]
MKITKAVIPAAGFGTRFLPVTKAVPKELLPIVNKPAISYVVEEVVNSGIKDIIIVLTPQKQAIKTLFGQNLELENFLEKFGKLDQLEEVRALAKMANFTFVNQQGPYGNATPVLSAREYVKNEAFAVVWGDEFIYSNPPRLKQTIEAFEKYQKPVISAVRITNKADVSRYGIADIEPVEGNVFKIKKIVEKPKPEEAPSNLAAHGAYILPPEIFQILDKLQTGKSGELWLVDAITELMKTTDVYACEIENGKYYDTGNKLEYLKTNLDFALRDPDIAEGLKEYIRSLKI